MITRFLKAKHWQLFLLTVGVPLTLQVVFMVSIITNIATGHANGASSLFQNMTIVPVISVLVMVIFFGWFWSIVVGLQKIIPEEAKMKLGRFKIFFFIPLVYILFFSLFIGQAMNGLFISSGGMVGMMGIIFPLHLFSMFCIFHSLYFAAKAFKTAELKRAVSFSDFAGEFFLIWFYPIGIWIIQPKINKLVQEEEGTAFDNSLNVT